MWIYEIAMVVLKAGGTLWYKAGSMCSFHLLLVSYTM